MFSKYSNITMTEDTIFLNEWDYTPVAQSVTKSLSGDVTIEVLSPGSYQGRPIILEVSWVDAITLRRMVSLRDSVNQRAHILRLCDGREFPAVFDHGSGNPIKVTPIVPRPDYYNQVSPDYYDVILNLVEGEVSDTLSFSYGTFNPSDKNANVVLTNGNLTAETNLIGLRSVRSTFSKNDEGTVYCEFTIDADPVGDGEIVIGIGNPSANLATYAGATSDSYGYYGADGDKLYNGTSVAYGDPYTVGDIIQMAYDMNNGLIWFGKNGTWYGDPVARSNPAFTGITGDMHVMVSIGRVGNKVTGNFGASGFSSWFPQGFLPGLIEEV